MPFYFRTGVGPVRYSKRLSGGRKVQSKTAQVGWSVFSGFLLLIAPLAFMGAWGWLITGPLLVLIVLALFSWAKGKVSKSPKPPRI